MYGLSGSGCGWMVGYGLVWQNGLFLECGALMFRNFDINIFNSDNLFLTETAKKQGNRGEKKVEE